MHKKYLINLTFIRDKIVIQRTHLNTIKGIHDKPITNKMLNGKKWKAFPLKSGTRQRCYHYFYSTQYGKSQPQQSDKKRKKIIQVGREEVKLSLYVDHMWKNHSFDYTDLYQQRDWSQIRVSRGDAVNLLYLQHVGERFEL